MRSSRAYLPSRFLLSLMCSAALLCFCVTVVMAQGSSADYSKFLHSSQRHASQACSSCHQRSDNSSTPRFPGHHACTGCHLGQFTTPATAMCMICHTDMSNPRESIRTFPTSFKETFNVSFNHDQHLKGAARPQAGCAGCHTTRGAGVSIPAGLNAHNICYTCHTPASKSAAGNEIATCGVCHNVRRYSPTSVNARSYRLSFSHTKHSGREKLECSSCHEVSGSNLQGRQMNSPSGFEHFANARGVSCASCHNGRKSFGGDISFKDCRRCHTAATFKMPL